MQRFCPRGAIPFHQLSWWLGLSAVNKFLVQFSGIHKLADRHIGIVGALLFIYFKAASLILVFALLIFPLCF